MRRHELTKTSEELRMLSTVTLHCRVTKIDIWDTDYNSDNWEPEFMTICMTWLLRVTLDSICNSCNVYRRPISSIHWLVTVLSAFNVVPRGMCFESTCFGRVDMEKFSMSGLFYSLTKPPYCTESQFGGGITVRMESLMVDHVYRACSSNMEEGNINLFHRPPTSYEKSR